MNSTASHVLLNERLGPIPEEADYPLSYSQQRLWFLDQLHPASAAYVVPFAYRVRGPLDVAALESALSEIVRRHGVLRTVFCRRNDQVRQLVLPPEPVEIPLTELSGVSNAEEEAQKLTTAEARTPFDLTTGPLLRARLLRIGPDDHLFLLSFHHIVFDAWSIAILGREISTLYKAHLERSSSPLPELPLQYGDFAEWQQEFFNSPERERLLAYWRNRLADIPSCINLPTDRPRPPVQSYEGAHVKFTIPERIVTAVEDLARRHKTTPFVVFFSAFSALLYRYTGGEEVVIGVASANRHYPDVESLIGFFTNALVFRPDLAGSANFTDLIARVNTESRQALAHQDLPFEMLVDELQPDRNAAHSPLFQVMFFHWDGEGNEVLQLPGCEISNLIGDSGTAKFDLTLSLSREGAVVQARLEYSTALFDESTVIRMAKQYNTVVDSVVSDPTREVAALPILPPEEYKLLAEDWPDGGPSQAPVQAIPLLIAAQVARTPNTTALVDSSRMLTYRELDEESGILAARLQMLGVRTRDTVVGVSLSRSAHTVVALLGILKAGGAYLPLDPTYPAERLSFMVADSSTSIVVSTVDMAGQLAALGVVVVCVDNLGAKTAPLTPLATQGDDLAYLMYTSGSTGKPKGVKITHSNLVTFFQAMDKTFGDDPPGTWLAVTSVSFDISVLELLWTLTRGYRVIIRADEPAAAASRTQSNAKSEPAHSIDFSLFYFGNMPADGTGNAERYRLLLDGARFADTHGFSGVWNPERHFHSFGGLYPNPSVLAAALAVITKRIAIRAGSVVLPLHDPLRVAEEWAVVDNLSGGRVGISFASGWQPNDFVLAPDSYRDRKQEMLRAIAEVRKLWRGERVLRRNGAGSEIEVGIYPMPVQKQLPVWLTSARHADTFKTAGEIGSGLLTHLVGQSVEELSGKITLYRSTWQASGHPGKGHVTLMLHTLIGADVSAVRSLVHEPLKDYIRTSFDLMAGLGAARKVDVNSLPERELNALLDQAVERFFASAGLFGTPGMAADTLDRLAALGIDEVGCLIDFGVPVSEALTGLQELSAAREEHLQRRDPGRKSGDALGKMDKYQSVASQLRRYGVTHFQCTPALAATLVADPESKEALRSLRRMLVGGEALSPELAATLASAVGGTVHNMYGPTEATVWATTHTVRLGEPVLIGRPLPGYSAYIVDAALRLVPIGVPGELVLGGEAIAAGYHQHEELTRERFIPDKFSKKPGGRLYRTGDKARWNADGNLQYLARLDNQVKLRGRRIELGEIEAALLEHPEVLEATVDVRGEGDRRGIVGYLVFKQGEHPARDALHNFLARTLPDYMLPSAYVAMNALPRTPNGKLNRNALPDPEQERPSLRTELCPPRNHLELQIATVWQEVIGVKQVGVNDNFFDLGGNSILAVAVRAKLMEKLVDEVSLIDIFRYPTVASLAAALPSATGSRQTQTAMVMAGAEAGERRRAALSRAARSSHGRSTS
jgi:natural product biosynthesis luciferase-like monooxygenase protein